jgi:periplasmic divalent cation tolerance protein
MSDYIQVITTTESEQDAAKIGRMLVDGHLAACVQISGPVTSIFRWKGELETGREWRLEAKSRRDLYPEIEAAIRRAHPYEEPEILAVPVAAGSEGYLRWLDGEVKPP